MSAHMDSPDGRRTALTIAQSQLEVYAWALAREVRRLLRRCDLESGGTTSYNNHMNCTTTPGAE